MRRATVLLICVFTLCCQTVWASGGYRIGIQPCWMPEKALEILSPLSEYLSKALGVPVELVVYDNASQFHQGLDKLDMIIQDAYSAYLHSMGSFVPLVIAENRSGETTDRGAVIVRKNSPFKTLSDLRGRSFLFGAAHNTAKFFSVWILFEENGIDPARDLSEIAEGGG